MSTDQIELDNLRHARSTILQVMHDKLSVIEKENWISSQDREEILITVLRAIAKLLEATIPLPSTPTHWPPQDDHE